MYNTSNFCDTATYLYPCLSRKNFTGMTPTATHETIVEAFNMVAESAMLPVLDPAGLEAGTYHHWWNWYHSLDDEAFKSLFTRELCPSGYVSTRIKVEPGEYLTTLKHPDYEDALTAIAAVSTPGEYTQAVHTFLLNLGFALSSVGASLPGGEDVQFTTA